MMSCNRAGMLLLAACGVCTVHGLQNCFKRPQMGWNSWNHFGCGVTEQDIKDTADAFLVNGMKAAGCEYVNSMY